MNAKLKDAIREIAALPAAEQQEVADGLIAYARIVRKGQPLLTAEQRDGVIAAQDQARAGDFASNKELAEVWRSFNE